MTTKEMLEKHGWTRLSYRKMGCMIIATWHDSKTGQNMRQGLAVQTQSERNKARRGFQIQGTQTHREINIAVQTAAADAEKATVVFNANVPETGDLLWCIYCHNFAPLEAVSCGHCHGTDWRRVSAEQRAAKLALVAKRSGKSGAVSVTS
jgi:hypothetical protein